MTDKKDEQINLHDTTDAGAWAEAFCKMYPSALCQIDGREGITDGDDFEHTMLGWFANAIMAGVDSANRAQAARIAELEAQLATARIDALDQAEVAMREECTAPDGTYDMKTEADIAQAEAATIEVASRAILALKTETPT